VTTADATAPLSLDARLGLDRYETDATASHIEIDSTRCVSCTPKPCLTCCPAWVYRLVDDRVAVRYENCLECGTCQIACNVEGRGGLAWRIPAGGFGIRYRYG
jgi:ferredoxin like protein